MSATWIQTGAGSGFASSATYTVNYSSAIITGDLIVVGLWTDTATTALNTVTDNAGNTYHLTAFTTGSTRTWMYYTIASSSVNSLITTGTFSGSVHGLMLGTHYRGTTPATTWTSQKQTSSISASSQAVGMATEGVAIAFCADSAATTITTFTPDSAWTTRVTGLGSTVGRAIADRNIIDSGSYAATAVWSVAGTLDTLMTIFSGVTSSVAASGSYDLTVTVNGVTLTLVDAITTVPFTLTTVLPDTVSTAGGDTLTITGTGFVNPTCTIGGTSVTPANVTSTSFTVTMPALGASVYDVVVVDGGVTNTLIEAITVTSDFALTSVSPSSVSTSGGETLTVVGAGFANPTCTIGGTSVTPTNVTNTSFNVTMPAKAAGSYNVAVTVSGSTLTLTSAITVAASTFAFTSVSPTYVYADGGETLTISGSGFVNPTCTIGGVSVTPTNVTSTSFTVTMPSTIFTIIGVSPSSVSTDGGETLLITGSGFNNPTCSIGGTSVTPTNVTNTSFNVTMPAKAAGSYNVAVTSNTITNTLVGAITVASTGITTYFADDFSSGDMLKVQSGSDAVWNWGRNPQGSMWVDVVSGFSRWGNTGYSVRARYNTAGTADELSGAGQPKVPVNCPIRFPFRVRANWWDSTNSNRHFPQSGSTVTWSVISGSGTLAATTSVTDTTGTAVMMYTAGAVAGVNTVRATLSTGQTRDISFTSMAAPISGSTATSLTTVGGDIKINGVEQDKSKNCYWEENLRVKASNASGVGVRNVAVTWAVVSGSATIPFSSSLTDSQGIAYCLPKFGATAGGVTITATSTGLTGSPQVFTATALNDSGTITTVHTTNELLEAKGTHEGEAQLALGLGDWLEDMTIEAWYYFPAGGEVIAGFTENAHVQRGRWQSSTFDYLGNANNKWFAMYEYYSDAISRIIQSWSRYGTNGSPPAMLLPLGWRPLGSTTYYKQAKPQVPGMYERRGYWHRYQWRYRVESAEGANDGYIEIRINGVPVMKADTLSERRPPDWVGPISGMTFVNKWKYLYMLGYANSGYARETHAFISDFRASSDFINDIPVSHGFTTFSPTTAAAAGGTTLTLTGTGFTAETMVWFVPQTLTESNYSSPGFPSTHTATSLTVTTPALAAGTYTIYISQAGTSVAHATSLTVS